MVEGAIRYCGRCAETVDAGLPRTAGIINHAAQVGFSTLVRVQVRVALLRPGLHVSLCDRW